MRKELEGKVAIVTGASSGIGKAVAELFAENGAKVVVSDINDEYGEKVVESIRRAGAEAIYVHADVSKAEDCAALVAKTVETFGALHIACNNAGIGGVMAPTADQTIENWQHVIDVNLNSVFFCMKYQIPEMLKSGKGAIVNISSILGQVGFAGAAAYVSAKHALVGLGRTAALEYGTAGIRVNTVGPAFIKTPMVTALDEDVLNKQIAPLHALGRLGEPEEVAELVLWLSSDRASFATGAYYPIDGGYLAR
jgi:NAD(P)-dependent dehydrogenase (short-subunit alcohol dehydrogenase family)